MPIRLTLGQKSIQFDTDAVSVGSAADDAFSIPGSGTLKPRHAAFRRVQGRWIAESVEGGPLRVGTGRPSRFAWLNPGDVVHFGDDGPAIRFDLVDAPAGLPPSPPPSSPGKAKSPARPRSGAALDAPKTVGPSSTAVLRRPPVAIVAAAVGAAIVSVAAMAAWMVSSERDGDRETSGAAPASVPSPAGPPPAALAPAEPAAGPAVADPRDYLVVVGIGDLRNNARPHVLGVGWLWDDRTAVVPRPVGNALSAMEVAMADQESPPQVCVIQGIPLEVVDIRHPAGCPDVSLLSTSEPAELPVPASRQWRRVTAADVERLRGRGRRLTYLSYERLPRPTSLEGAHDFPLTAYDPDVVRPASEDASLLYEERRHLFKPADAGRPLERGGLLVDDENRIVGMTLRDASVVWTDALEAAFPPGPR